MVYMSISFSFSLYKYGGGGGGWWMFYCNTQKHIRLPILICFVFGNKLYRTTLSDNRAPVCSTLFRNYLSHVCHFIFNTACCCFLYEFSWRANGKFCLELLHRQEPNTVPLWYGCMVQVLLHCIHLFIKNQSPVRIFFPNMITLLYATIFSSLILICVLF